MEIWVPLNTARDYIHIDEVCEYFKKLIEHKNGFEIFNVASGKAITIQELLNEWEQKFNKKIKYEIKDINFSRYYPKKNVLNIEKIKKLINKI